jgi:RimJ/RimL family protein N-acetyltransferase
MSQLPAPRIDTPRLVLRPIGLEDFDAYAAFMADADAARFIGGMQPRSMAWRSFMTLAGAWCLEGCSMFSVLEKSTGRWVGRVGPWQPDGWPGTEVGWGISREYWGRGYATEAATAAIEWAFTTLGWDDVIHVIDPANSASQVVARRVGARNRGPGRLPPPYDTTNVEIWGQTRGEWRARLVRSYTSPR